MIIRYHRGLGIGHIYSHGDAQIHATATSAATQTSASGTELNDPSGSEEVPDQEYDSDTENPELSFRNGEDDLGEVDENSVDSESDHDLELLEMVVMYGEGAVNDRWCDD
jgi:hypothetical protein